MGGGPMWLTCRRILGSLFRGYVSSYSVPRRKEEIPQRLHCPLQYMGTSIDFITLSIM